MPAIVMAVASSVKSWAIHIAVHDAPHDRTVVSIDHWTIDIAVDDPANDRPVINVANNDRPSVAIVVSIPSTVTVPVVPSGLSRCSS